MACRESYIQPQRLSRGPSRFAILALGFLLVWLVLAGTAFGQADQGAITGTVTDSTGASIPNAQITLTNTDIGLVLKGASDAAGNYTFSPVKIGHYSVSAAADGFSTTNQTGLQLSVQQRLQVNLTLQVGKIEQTVEVTAAPPLIQTEDSSVGQVVSTQAINDTPLNGRNWVFIAQLAAGTNGTISGSSRTAGNGSFSANGQRNDMNNFLLDGVDNNNNVVDFLNGATYLVRPPPDALAEFRVQTANYSAEFGHAAGGVVNASLKSGTNQVHGSLWEYVRNTSLTARDWNATSVQPYHQNQFGSTLGLPFIKNKLFFFGDLEANRIALSQFANMVVPTARMRVGDFGELNTNGVNQFNGGTGLQLFNTGSAGAPAILNNDLRALGTSANTPGQLSPAALKILSLYPCPGVTALQSAALIAGSGGNCAISRPIKDNTFQFDVRMDYNISASDQAFFRGSQSIQKQYRTPNLGNVLDGGAFGDSGDNSYKIQGMVFSEAHVFSPSIANEFRIGYNYAEFSQKQVNAGDSSAAASLGLGGLPSGFRFPGGLPALFGGGGQPSAILSMFPGQFMQAWGTPSFMGTVEHLNNIQLLDSVTKVWGAHEIKFGGQVQKVRFDTYQPSFPRGEYLFNGQFTSATGGATGSALADFMLNQMSTAAVTQPAINDQIRWDTALFIQDNWKVTKRLTLNLGIRWEDPTAYKDRHGRQANFVPTGTLGVGTGKANYTIPTPPNGQTVDLGPNFPTIAAANNVTVVNDPNQYLVDNAWKNFGPRIGAAYRISDRATIRAGWALIHAGLENIGYGPNIGQDFPFLPTSNFTPPSCSAGNCRPITFNGQPITLESGFVGPLNAPGGIVGSVTSPTINAVDPRTKTPYAVDYNATFEYGLTNDTSLSVAYVGSQAHKLLLNYNVNNAYALTRAGANINSLRAFPGFGNIATQRYDGQSAFNSLQIVVNHRYAKGFMVSSNYTLAHADAIGSGLVGGGGAAIVNSPLIPFGASVAPSTISVKHRFTFNGSYDLPFGEGRRFKTSKALDYVVGGWQLSGTFIAQTGTPLTISSTAYSGWSAAAGAGTPWALLVGDPFQGGGTPPANSPLKSCPATVHNRDNWYNPCAFADPVGNGSAITAGTQVTGADALPYFGSLAPGQIPGPGFNRVNTSLFKNIKIVEGKTLQFRVDTFNLLNHPTWAQPAGSNLGLTATGGKITGPYPLQTNAPDARFMQLSLKFLF